MMNRVFNHTTKNDAVENRYKKDRKIDNCAIAVSQLGFYATSYKAYKVIM